jgi:hypothetical protein
MLMDVFNRVLVMIFVLSTLNVIRHLFFLIGSFIKSDDELPQKFRLSQMQLLLLGVSVSYVITTLFTGITF